MYGQINLFDQQLSYFCTYFICWLRLPYVTLFNKHVVLVLKLFHFKLKWIMKNMCVHLFGCFVSYQLHSVLNYFEMYFFIQFPCEGISTQNYCFYFQSASRTVQKIPHDSLYYLKSGGIIYSELVEIWLSQCIWNITFSTIILF